jgi:hypothetical protein
MVAGLGLSGGKTLALAGGSAASAAAARARASEGAAQPGTGPVGEERTWLAADIVSGEDYLKDYTLRGVGEHIELWVASGEDEISIDTRFPEGDCRNDGRVLVTDEQVTYFIDEFDNNIYPIQAEAFSVPPDRDGSAATLPELADLPADYYVGDGDNIVVLVDNIRDENFYDVNHRISIGGFFYSLYNEYFDRNVMTIDAFDWLHRTGANPPNEPSTDLCTNAQARPYDYEQTFAHEYQHLLEYYEDPDETTWLNEGLSDYAMRITGYSNPRVPVTETGFDAGVQCLLGYLSVQTEANPIPFADGGPENSLNLWGDQGAEEILCDYGAAFTMMEYLAGRYGDELLSELHRDDANGFESLQRLLEEYDTGVDVRDVVHDWSAMLALDSVLDANGGRLLGASDDPRHLRSRDAGNYRTPTVDASTNWDENDAYDTPGAPPNGSDYVRLRGADGSYLSLADLSSLSFDGAETLPPAPVEWIVDENPPDHEGDPALYSGSGPGFDRAIVRPVTVPAEDPTLTFETRFETEEFWDFGFVQVSTDGGQTYTSLANELTTAEADPGAIEPVQENLPGFTGNSGGWVTTSFDLSAYAGQEILLSFRYVTDPAVDLPGWWIDDVTVGGELLSDGTSLEGWSTPTEINPVEVEGFTVQLVAYSSTDDQLPALLSRVELGAGDVVDLGGLAGQQAGYDVVAAIVSYNESTESITQYAPYTLLANGVLQPGGS